MNHVARITYTIAGLVAAALLVGAGSAVATVINSLPSKSGQETSSLSATTSPAAKDASKRLIYLGDGVSVTASSLPDGCTTFAMIEIKGTQTGDQPETITAELLGEPVDQGARKGATGTVHRDSEGRIVSYTAAAGDAISTIGERLCMDDQYLASYNYVGESRGEHALQPNETLIVRPDPSASYVPVHHN